MKGAGCRNLIFMWFINRYTSFSVNKTLILNLCDSINADMFLLKPENHKNLKETGFRKCIKSAKKYMKTMIFLFAWVFFFNSLQTTILLFRKYWRSWPEPDESVGSHFLTPNIFNFPGEKPNSPEMTARARITANTLMMTGSWKIERHKKRFCEKCMTD